MITRSDAIYGLRNLVIGDDEQTRIEDQPRQNLSPETLALLDVGEFELAYYVAIVEALANVPRPELEAAITEWVTGWNAQADWRDDDGTEFQEVTPAELLAEFDEIIARKEFDGVRDGIISRK